MQKASPNFTLLILSISSPLLIGVYRDNELIEEVEREGKISDILLRLIKEIMQRYPISSIIYTRGPGSHMAIKLTYIMLKTIEIGKKIPLFGCSGFLFNDNRPIKAIGALYFIREADKILTKKFDSIIAQKYSLPASLSSLTIDDSSEPDYILPAVDSQIKDKDQLCS